MVRNKHSIYNVLNCALLESFIHSVIKVLIEKYFFVCSVRPLTNTPSMFHYNPWVNDIVTFHGKDLQNFKARCSFKRFFPLYLRCRTCLSLYIFAYGVLGISFIGYTVWVVTCKICLNWSTIQVAITDSSSITVDQTNGFMSCWPTCGFNAFFFTFWHNIGALHCQL